MQSKDKSITNLKKCKICGNTNLKKVLQLNEQYISATFVKSNANNKQNVCPVRKFAFR